MPAKKKERKKERKKEVKSQDERDLSGALEKGYGPMRSDYRRSLLGQFRRNRLKIEQNLSLIHI